MEPSPARLQATEAQVASFYGGDNDQPEPGMVWNVWYQSWAGNKRKNQKRRSPFKCDPERDIGRTKSHHDLPLCIWFARGMCTSGPACHFVHQMPSLARDRGPTTDIFGRDKHSEYRSDYGGVGTFSQTNCTLFVGYFQGVKEQELAKKLRDQFAVWGPVSSVRVIKGKFAFVTYTAEVYAQFAKEAMANQTITGKETLEVRWAAPTESGAKPGNSSDAESTVRQLLGDTFSDSLQGRRKVPKQEAPADFSSKESSAKVATKPQSMTSEHVEMPSIGQYTTSKPMGSPGCSPEVESETSQTPDDIVERPDDYDSARPHEQAARRMITSQTCDSWSKNESKIFESPLVEDQLAPKRLLTDELVEKLRDVKSRKKRLISYD